MDNLFIQASENKNAATTMFIMGMTATGKTDLSIAIKTAFCAKKTVDLISVDSALVYQGLDIGSAKPDAKTLAQAPHSLIDMIKPSENYSAGQFRKDALKLMQQSVQQQHLPLLVGGTMLYFNALQKGIATMPQVGEAVKLKLADDEKENGLLSLYSQLEKIDPVSAKRLHPNDAQRIKRALEIYYATGETLTHFWKKQPAQQSFAYHTLKIALIFSDREKLRKRITQRFDLMLQQGLIAEVETLYHRGDLTIEKPAMRAVGYRQVWQYLNGELNYDEMREKAIIATAQLAKRQMTWLRKESNCNFIEAETLNEKKRAKLLKNLENLLL